jgi:hypothetical protein
MRRIPLVAGLVMALLPNGCLSVRGCPDSPLEATKKWCGEICGDQHPIAKGVVCGVVIGTAVVAALAVGILVDEAVTQTNKGLPKGAQPVGSSQIPQSSQPSGYQAP